MDLDHDFAARQEAITYVNDIADANGGSISRLQLEAFTFAGQQIKLIDTSRGIRNPQALIATVSVMTSPDGPYEDHLGDDGLWRYAIRAGDWGAGDNRKLQIAFEMELPLIWLRKMRDAVFVPVAPVWLVGAEPNLRRYAVAITPEMRWAVHAPSMTPLERRFVLAMAKRRLHQPMFRARVIDAYGHRCAVCSLPQVELLDAAHITPDADEAGDPVISNGLTLCKIHHAAYDANVLGIDEMQRVHVATKVLHKVDGPMLIHGLQAFHGDALRVVPAAPREQPDPERLARRFTDFLRAAS